MPKNDLLSKDEKRKIVNELESIGNCNNKYMINRLKNSRNILAEIINICENMIIDYTDIIHDIHHHDKLKKNPYKLEKVIEDEYLPKITKRRGTFNEISKSLNNQIKKMEMAFNNWLNQNIDTLYMYYSNTNDYNKSIDTDGWLIIINDLLCYPEISSPWYDVSNDFDGLLEMYDSGELTEEELLKMINLSIGRMNINCALAGTVEIPYVKLDKDRHFLWDI